MKIRTYISRVDAEASKATHYMCPSESSHHRSTTVSCAHLRSPFPVNEALGSIHRLSQANVLWDHQIRTCCIAIQESSWSFHDVQILTGSGKSKAKWKKQNNSSVRSATSHLSFARCPVLSRSARILTNNVLVMLSGVLSLWPSKFLSNLLSSVTVNLSIHQYDHSVLAIVVPLQDLTLGNGRLGNLLVMSAWISGSVLIFSDPKASPLRSWTGYLILLSQIGQTCDLDILSETYQNLLYDWNHQ